MSNISTMNNNHESNTIERFANFTINSKCSLSKTSLLKCRITFRTIWNVSHLRSWECLSWGYLLKSWSFYWRIIQWPNWVRYSRDNQLWLLTLECHRENKREYVLKGFPFFAENRGVILLRIKLPLLPTILITKAPALQVYSLLEKSGKMHEFRYKGQNRKKDPCSQPASVWQVVLLLMNIKNGFIRNSRP